VTTVMQVKCVPLVPIGVPLHPMALVQVSNLGHIDIDIDIDIEDARGRG
jgi:hypothetical protein